MGLTSAEIVGEKHMSRPEAADYPILRIGGSAWGGMMTMCPDHKLSAEFWSNVKPSAAVKAEVDAFKEEKLGAPQPGGAPCLTRTSTPNLVKGKPTNGVLVYGMIDVFG